MVSVLMSFASKARIIDRIGPGTKHKSKSVFGPLAPPQKLKHIKYHPQNPWDQFLAELGHFIVFGGTQKHIFHGHP